MNDDGLDLRVRQAFAAVDLPPDRLAALVAQAPPASRDRTWIGLVAAAVLLLVAMPVIRPVWELATGSSTPVTLEAELGWADRPVQVGEQRLAVVTGPRGTALLGPAAVTRVDGRQVRVELPAGTEAESGTLHLLRSLPDGRVEVPLVLGHAPEPALVGQPVRLMAMWAGELGAFELLWTEGTVVGLAVPRDRVVPVMAAIDDPQGMSVLPESLVLKAPKDRVDTVVRTAPLDRRVLEGDTVYVVVRGEEGVTHIGPALLGSTDGETLELSVERRAAQTLQQADPEQVHVYRIRGGAVEIPLQVEGSVPEPWVNQAVDVWRHDGERTRLAEGVVLRHGLGSLAVVAAPAGSIDVLTLPRGTTVALELSASGTDPH